MSRKIKLHTFNVLFQLFAYLADRTGGWRVFVRPKLLLGSLIVGLGLTGCGTKASKENTEISKNGFNDSIKRVEVNQDTTEFDEQPPQFKSTMCYFTAPIIKKENKPTEPMVTCYDTEVNIKDTIDNKSSKQSTSRSTKQIDDLTDISCYLQISIKDTDNEEKTVQEDKNKIYKIADQMPQFPGGDIELMNFLEKQIKYPSIESISNINGKVICGFIVNKDGSISDIRIYRSLDPTLDSIAVKAIKAMPNYIPGKQNGQAVRVRYTLPIIFRTQE